MLVPLTPKYLKYMCRSSKWYTGTSNFQVGDIVCVREGPIAPTRWPLARVIEVHPGQDGKVRVVTIRTAKGVYTRKVVKLVPLVQDKKKE